MLIKNIQKLVVLLSIFISVLLLAGCGKAKNPDPFESVNRSSYSFNKGADRLIAKPVARAYETLIPKVFRYLIGNFFQNLGEIPTVINDVLQGEFSDARRDSARFILNSTWGVGGLLDVANAKGKMPVHNQDFGKTLYVWGYKESAYFVIPVFGPSTVRDAIGRGVGIFMNICTYMDSSAYRDGLYTLSLVNMRANFLKIEPLIGEAVDEYLFVRNAYLQNRQYALENEARKAESQATEPSTETKEGKSSTKAETAVTSKTTTGELPGPPE